MRSHLRQNSPSHLSLRRTSTRSTRGQWKTTKFHDESAYYVSGFLTQLSKPLSIDEALSRPDSAHWRTAMETEYNSLIKNNTWTLVDPPPNESIVSSKWLFRRKYKSDGSIDRYKASFVARGFSN